MSDDLFIALIGAGGIVLAALIRQIKPPSKQRKRAVGAALLIGLGIVGLASGVALTWFRDPCNRAQIVAPVGSNRRADAFAYEVPARVDVEWRPSDCVMVVQAYQGNRLVSEKSPVRSGSEFLLGRDGSGETEIKIWRNRRRWRSDAIWVWIGA